MASFGSEERRILSYFEKGKSILFNGKNQSIIEAGKPTSPKGEPKTDIYVLLADDNDNKEEIKISYKMESADFIENKTSAERAEQLLGPDWKIIVENSTNSIKDEFYKRALIYKNGLGRTEKGSITIGWKFELVNKKSGALSGEIELTTQQVYDVYAGTNLSADKKDAMVNGRVVANSGVANYLLISDNVKSAQEVVDTMISIDNYVAQYPKIYFACKALNYRTFAKKHDGNRPLAVQVDWSVTQSGELVPNLIFDSPLVLKGDEMADRLKTAMKLLKISTTDDINHTNADITIINE